MAAIRTPSKKQIAELAQSNDRFALMNAITPRVPLGTRRCCDVKNIGPANQRALKFAVDEWDSCVQSRQQSPPVRKLSCCKGIFFSAFAKKQFSRRCDSVATKDGLCDLCRELRKNSKEEIVLPKPAYDVVKVAVFSRPGIKECNQFWKEEAKKLSKEFKCPVQYPFFSARDTLDMVLMDGRIIYEDGGRSGKSYPRSACIIEAQNEHVKACLKSILGILIFEKRQQFRERWNAIISTANSIHDYFQGMHDDETGQIGLLQASDIIREELARACQVCKLKKCPARHLSLPVQRLIDWVINEKMKNKSASSPESIDTPASNCMQTPHPARAGKTPQLPMQKVSQAQHRQQKNASDQAEATAASISLHTLMKDFSIPARKKTIVQDSTIDGAGQGLFLTEPAKDKEMIGRFSGKVLSAEQASKSKSQYILRINKDLFLDAEEEGHLEGRKLNCARKAGRKANARFRSTFTVNYCKVTGVAWIPFYAVGDIVASVESPEEMMVDYGELYWKAREGEARIACADSSFSEVDHVSDDEDSEADHDSDEDFVPSAAAAAPTSRQRPKTRSMRDPVASASRSALVWENAHGEALGSDGKVLQQHQDSSRQLATTSSSSSRKHDTATQLQFSSPSSSEASKANGDVNLNENTVFAVSVGRCIGLFLSMDRMQQSLWHYTRSRFKTCTSIAQAEAYMASFSIPQPRRYWTESFEEGSLLTNPRELMHRRVCFPVGMLHDFYQPPCGFGTIMGTSMESGRQCWSVRMDTGFTDQYVQEWPLICALEKARAVLGPAATAPMIQFHAVRGIPESGVFETISDVPQSVRNDHSKYQIFQSRLDAQRWIQLWKSPVFFAVRGSKNDGVDTDIEMAILRKDEYSEMKKFNSREAALKWVAEHVHVYFALRGTEDEDGVYRSKEEVLLRLNGKFAEYKQFATKVQASEWVQNGKCFVMCSIDEEPKVIMKEALKAAKIEYPTAEFKGPFTIVTAYAVQEMLASSGSTSQRLKSRRTSSTSMPVAASDGSHCIARLADGSVCGRTASIRQTPIGMLCGWHASSIGTTSQTNSQQPVNAAVDLTTQKDVEASPMDGIRLPSSAETLQKEKSKQLAVFALRTFPDDEAPASPAGSIWLSSTKAEAANKRGGRIQMFNEDEHKDIFENIANAQSWIEAQVESVKEDSQSEFERRLKESRSRMNHGGRGGKGVRSRNRGRRSRRGAGRGSKEARSRKEAVAVMNRLPSRRIAIIQGTMTRTNQGQAQMMKPNPLLAARKVRLVEIHFKN